MKKVLVGVLVVAAVGAGLFFAERIPGKATVKSNPRAPEGTAEVVTLLTKDTDGDGLKDWEEELWGTNAADPDTDKDGTKDEEEIRLGRNPLVAGPNDPLDKSVLEEKTTVGKDDGPETETDRVARGFLKTYLEVKQGGGTLSAEAIEELAARAFENTPTLSPPVYTVADLTRETERDTATVRAYGNAVGTIIGAAPAFIENEMAILDKAARAEDPEYIKRLDPIIALYDGLLADLTALPVPEGAEDEHIALLASIGGVRLSIAKMRKLFENPIVVLPALSLYEESADNMVLAFRALDQYFLGQGISFSKSEGGYLITRLGI